MTKIQEGHIGSLQTVDHRVAHLPPDKQKLAKQHHSLGNAAAMRADVKGAEKHFSEFKRIVGETVQEEWKQGPPKQGEGQGKIVKLNDGGMGKIAHEAGVDLAVHVSSGRNGTSLKRIPRTQVHAHHVVEEEVKKNAKQVRGRTATGQKANVIDTEPTIRFNALRKKLGR